MKFILALTTLAAAASASSVSFKQNVHERDVYESKVSRFPACLQRLPDVTEFDCEISQKKIPAPLAPLIPR